MGCVKSPKYVEVCKSDEGKFEGLMAKYCGTQGDRQSSIQKSTNYGIVNLVSDEEDIYDVKECSCSFNWTEIE